MAFTTVSRKQTNYIRKLVRVCSCVRVEWTVGVGQIHHNWAEWSHQWKCVRIHKIGIFILNQLYSTLNGVEQFSVVWHGVTDQFLETLRLCSPHCKYGHFLEFKLRINPFFYNTHCLKNILFKPKTINQAQLPAKCGSPEWMEYISATTTLENMILRSFLLRIQFWIDLQDQNFN